MAEIRCGLEGRGNLASGGTAKCRKNRNNEGGEGNSWSRFGKISEHALWRSERRARSRDRLRGGAEADSERGAGDLWGPRWRWARRDGFCGLYLFVREWRG